MISGTVWIEDNVNDDRVVPGMSPPMLTDGVYAYAPTPVPDAVRVIPSAVVVVREVTTGPASSTFVMEAFGKVCVAVHVFGLARLMSMLMSGLLVVTFNVENG